MKKLVKRPRRFSSGGAIIKYQNPAGKMGLKRVLKPVVKSISKLPTRTRDFFIKNAPLLPQLAAVAKSVVTNQSDDELEEVIDRQTDRRKILNRAEQIKKGTERNGYLNIVPGGVYTIYNPETLGVEIVKVYDVNEKTDNVLYIDKDGFAHQTTPQMFFNMYSHYRNGWMDQSSTSSEPVITINTEGPATTKTPVTSKYRLIQSWTNPNTGEKLTINDIAADGHVAGYSIGHLLFLTNSDEEFEAALLKFMNQKAQAVEPEPHITIGNEPEPTVTPGATQTVLEFSDMLPEPVVEEPAKTTLEVGQVFGNDGDKFTITQIDEDGKIHANRVKGDATYTDLVYGKQLDFFGRLSDEGISHEPIQSAVEEPVVEEPVVEEPVVEEPVVEEPVAEEKPESTVSPEPKETIKTTPTEKEVAPKPEPSTEQPQLTAEQISDAARRELNNKGILIDLLDNAEEGKNVYSQDTGKIHRYTKNKKGELVLSKESRKPTKGEQELINKIFDEETGKTKKTRKRSGKWWKWPAGIIGTEALIELGTLGAVGTLDAIGAAALDEDWKEGFGSGWKRGRNKTLSNLLKNAVRALGVRSYMESHNMMPDDWKDFINYYERNHANTFMKWLDDNGIYGDDVYTKSWENQEMKNAYNTWKNGNQ